jgi:serine O-acetyltransferase
MSLNTVVPVRYYSTANTTLKLQWKQVLEHIKEDVDMIVTNDPALKSRAEVLFYLGLWAVFTYRIANFLHLRWNMRLLSKFMTLWARITTGIEIHPAARIGPGLFIDHGCGVVVGETSVIGSNCILFHGCTLGATGLENGKRHPTIGDRVFVGAGAKILGNITVGSDVRIGAGSVVLKDIPDRCTVVGIPGRIVPHGKNSTTLK